MTLLTFIISPSNVIITIIHIQNVRIGCRLSPQLLANYEANEKRHSRITFIMIKTVFLVVGGLFLLTGIVPFWYAIFGCPQPDRWTLSVEYT